MSQQCWRRWMINWGYIHMRHQRQRIRIDFLSFLFIEKKTNSSLQFASTPTLEACYLERKCIALFLHYYIYYKLISFWGTKTWMTQEDAKCQVIQNVEFTIKADIMAWKIPYTEKESSLFFPISYHLRFLSISCRRLFTTVYRSMIYTVKVHIYLNFVYRTVIRVYYRSHRRCRRRQGAKMSENYICWESKFKFKQINYTYSTLFITPLTTVYRLAAGYFNFDKDTYKSTNALWCVSGCA